jgi:aspartate/tyrosine/aromatic aminotransferase
MFEQLTPAPPDAILGITEAFKRDPNPNKINLSVGVFKDAAGNTPILKSVRAAEGQILETETTKGYLPIDGPPAFNRLSQELVFGPENELIQSGRAVTLQAPGGTGALRVAADFIARQTPQATVWVSEPTWPNHLSVFQAAGLKVATYPYFDATSNSVNFEGMMAGLHGMAPGDVVVLHGCCHNPTGVDLAAEQWQQVAQTLAARGALPLLDFAYQGFAEGLEEDARGVRLVCAACPEAFVANSYSKNFGLYSERVGALTFVGQSQAAADAVLSHLKVVVRANYSNPPGHGASIVAQILGDPGLRAQWEVEVGEMRDRINAMRHLFVETLNEQGVEQDFGYIARQRGMFSFSGLTPEQVRILRDEYAIYIVGSGRINVAGMTEDSMDYLCAAIADVLRRSA